MIAVKAGRGGDGAVAFHREKFKSRGPPSGGNGGTGGHVYVQSVPGMTSLASVASKSRAQDGQQGRGTWLHGRAGRDCIIKVPVGTVLQELEAMNEPALESDNEASMSPAQRDAVQRQGRASMFVYYPTDSASMEDDNHFQKVESGLLSEAHRRSRHATQRPLLHVDLSSTSAPILVARGGAGGMGNPAFGSGDVRSPKFATRGTVGETLRYRLELKLLADIGLVGLPNRVSSHIRRSLCNHH